MVFDCANRHYQHPICTALLVVKEGEYPELRIKAYAGRVLLAFLQESIACLCASFHRQNLSLPEPLPLVHVTLTAMCKWFLLVESAQRYLTRDQADEIWATSMKWLSFHVKQKL